MMGNRYAILAVLLAGLFLFGCAAQGSIGGSASPTPSNGYGGSGTSAQGRAVFGIADAAADMGSVTSVQMAIDKVEVHSATEGWVTVSSAPKTFDLMQLKAQSSTALLADAKLEEGTYDQMRMDVTSVTVVDAQGSHAAKMPSNELKFDGDLVVKANSTSSAKFDVLADESLHLAGNAEGKGQAEAKYVMAPVMHVETRENAQVDASSQSSIKIGGGTVDTDAKVGMDIHGNMGVGLEIPADVEVLVSSTGAVSILGSGSGSVNSTASGVVGVVGGAAGSASGSAGAGASGSGSASGSAKGSGSAAGNVAGALGGSG